MRPVSRRCETSNAATRLGEPPCDGAPLYFARPVGPDASASVDLIFLQLGLSFRGGGGGHL